MKIPEHPIFLESVKYIRSKLGTTGLDQVQQSILERIIHSSGDFSLKSCIRFSPNACEKAINALQNGAKIVTDTYMAEAAISYAAYFTQEGTWVGVNNNTDFIKGVTEGVIICEATPIKLGKRSQIWEAKLYNNEVECARSTVRLTNIDRS